MTKKKKTLRAAVLASIFAMSICGWSNTVWAELNDTDNYLNVELDLDGYDSKVEIARTAGYSGSYVLKDGGWYAPDDKFYTYVAPDGSVGTTLFKYDTITVTMTNGASFVVVDNKNFNDKYKNYGANFDAFSKALDDKAVDHMSPGNAWFQNNSLKECAYNKVTVKDYITFLDDGSTSISGTKVASNETIADLLQDNVEFALDLVDTRMQWEEANRKENDKELKTRIDHIDISYNRDANTLTFATGRKDDNNEFVEERLIALKDTTLQANSNNDNEDKNYSALEIVNGGTDNGKLKMTVRDTDNNEISSVVSIGEAKITYNNQSQTIQDVIDDLSEGWTASVGSNQEQITAGETLNFAVEESQNLTIGMTTTNGVSTIKIGFSENPEFESVTVGTGVTAIDIGCAKDGVISVGTGANKVVIDGTSGTANIGKININGNASDGSATITGLTNTTLSWMNDENWEGVGRAATEEQLRAVQNNISTDIKNINKNNVTLITDNDNGDRNKHTWVVTQKEGGVDKSKEIKDYNTTNSSLSNTWSENESVSDNDNITITLTDSDGESVSTIIKDVAKASNMGDISDIKKDGTGNTNGNTVVNNINNIYYELDKGWDAQIDGVTVNKVKMGGVQNFETGTNIVLDKGDNGSIKISTKEEVDFIKVTTPELILKDEDKITNVKYDSEDNRITYGENVIATTNDGYNYVSDIVKAVEGEEGVYAKLNKTISVIGGVTDESKLTDGNIGVVTSQSVYGDNVEMVVKLSKDVSGLDTLESNTVTVKETLKVAETVEITKDGIDMNDTKIVNVKDGEVSKDSKDAVNGGQLYQEQQERIAGDNMLSNRLDKLGNRVDKVGAGAAALAALHPLDFDPDDKLSFSAGVGNYGGETATALGMFYRPTEKVMLSAAGTMGNGENMVNMGVTFALDKTNNVSNSRVAMAREIQDLREQVAALTALVTQLAGRSNPALQDVVMFPDVPENHWAYDYIEGLQKRGIVEGYPDGNFAGDRSMTRYEYAAMLYRALEKGFPVDSRLLDEFDAELGRIRVDRIKGLDDDANKVERVRVNQYEDRDDYGSKLIAVNAVKQ